MIDFHTHILPSIDDGSKSIEESLAMLRTLKAQCVDTVVLTPHYYADQESVCHFLSRREKAFAQLQEAVSREAELPSLKLGSEVAFFSGISMMKDLNKLEIEGTGYLLLEMPFETWSSLTIREVQRILINQGKMPIIAHIERYFKWQSTNRRMAELMDSGMIFQTNAEALSNSKTKRKIMHLIKDNRIQLLGSDCHNLTDRKPNIDFASSVIKRKLGEKTLERMERFAREILKSSG